MSNELILVSDKDPHIIELLKYNLEEENYKVVIANGKDVFDIALRLHPALIILEHCPSEQGTDDICLALKRDSITASIPIILISIKGDERDVLNGFSSGADDFMIKPFSMRELLARVKAQLRRTFSNDPTEDKYTIGAISIDFNNYEVCKDGQTITLTLKEFELLKLLAENEGKVLTRDFLLDRLWGYEFYGETRTVDVHIRHLRMKLGPEADYIQTIRGVGYKLSKPQSKP